MAAKLEQALGPYQWALTQSPGHATKLARQAVAVGHRTLVAIGGDGTVNEVVNGMLEVDRSVDRELSLGVIDAGTGG